MSASLSISKVMNSKIFLAGFTVVIISVIFSVDLNRFIAGCNLSGEKRPISNEEFEEPEIIPVAGAVGPESIAFNSINGEGPYTGVSDGRIIKWDQSERRWINFAVTSPERNGCEGPHDRDMREHICGRPLGLRFNEKTEELYIADAYMGLLVVGPNGGLATKLTTKAQSIPFRFTNSLDINQTTGVVYFTDSSSIYQRRDHISVVMSGDKTGRLMKYDPLTKETTVLLNNLSFPNGVALSKNGDFVLVAETTNCRILKLWLEPSNKAGRVEVFAEIPGFPDNIKRNHRGEFWVAIHSRPTIISKLISYYPWIGRALVNLPFDITAKVVSYLIKLRGCGLAVKLRDDGEILEMLEDTLVKKWKFASEVEETDGYLWIGSVVMPFVVKQKAI